MRSFVFLLIWTFVPLVARALPCTSYMGVSAFMAGASLSSTTLQSADLVNGGAATLNTSSNLGEQGSLCLAFSNSVVGVFDIEMSRLAISPAPGKTISYDVASLLSGGAGLKFWPWDHRTGLILYGGLQQLTQFQGVSSSQLQMNKITVPFVSGGLTFNLLASDFMSWGVELAGLYYFPVTSGIYQTQANLGAQAQTYFRFDLFSRLDLEFDIGARLLGENSNLVTQQETDIDYALKLVIPLGPSEGPLSVHTHYYYGD